MKLSPQFSRISSLLMLFLFLHSQSYSQRTIAYQILYFDTDTTTLKNEILDLKTQGVNAVHLRVNPSHIFTSYSDQLVNTSSKWAKYDAVLRYAKQQNMGIAISVGLDFAAPPNGSMDNFFGSANAAFDQHSNLGAAGWQRNGHTSLAYDTGVNQGKAFVEQVMDRYSPMLGSNLKWISVTTSSQAESGYNFLNDGEAFNQALYDYSPWALDKYRNEWLPRRYTDKTALNNAYGTNFSDFNTVVPPGMGSNNLQATFSGIRGKDWYNFHHELIRDFGIKMRNAVKAKNSNVDFVMEAGSFTDALSLQRITYNIPDFAVEFDGLKAGFSAMDFNNNPVIDADLLRANIKSKKIYTELNTNDVPSNISNVTDIENALKRVGQSAIDNGATWVDLLFNRNANHFNIIRNLASQLSSYSKTTVVPSSSIYIQLNDEIDNFSAVKQTWSNAGGSLTNRINVIIGEGPGSLTVNPTYSSFNPSANSITLTVSSNNINWTATEAASWLTISPSSGVNGNTTMTVTVTANTSSNSRTENIKFYNGSTLLTEVPVTQMGMSVEVNPALLSFNSTASSQNVALTSYGINWTATKTASWLTISPTSGSNGSTTMIATVTSNSTTGTRKDTINIFNGGNLIKRIPITQASNSTCSGCVGYLDGAWCPNGGGWAKNGSGGQQNVDIYIDGLLVASDFVPNYERPDLGGKYGFQYNYPDCYKDGQNHVLRAKFAGTNIELTNSGMTFNCSGSGCNTVLSASPSSLSFIATSAPSQTIAVSSTNVNWTATKSDSWITISPTSGNNGSTNITVSVSNNTGVPRNGTVTISGGSHTVTIPIAQTGTTPTCTNCVGYLDGAWCPNGGGWAKNGSGGQQNVDIYIDNTLVASNVIPTYNRPDVGGMFGFLYNYPNQYKDGQNHVLRVRFAGTNIELSGSGMTFNCPSNTLSTTVSDLSYSTSASSQSVVVSSTNINWTATKSDSWITVNPTTGTNGNTTVTISVLANSGASRNGTVTFSGSGATKTVNVRQMGTCVGCYGYLDGAWCPNGGGWAKNGSGGPTNVDIYIDGILVAANFSPNYNRTDLGGTFGYIYNYPTVYKDGQNHVLRMKFAGTNTELTNSGMTFNCSSGARIGVTPLSNSNTTKKVSEPEEHNFLNLIVAPNPVSDELKATLYLTDDNVLRISLTDITGRERISKQEFGKKGDNTIILNTKGLEEGTFIFSVQVGPRKVTKRVYKH